MGTEIVKTSRREKIRRLLANGVPTDQIVEKLAKGDTDKAKVIRSQIARMAQEDEPTQAELAKATRGSMLLDLYESAEALGRRAKKGNVQAIKLLYEATGFHNPRVQHEHSGEIQISIKGLPRPARLEDVTDADAIEEADVVSE